MNREFDTFAACADHLALEYADRGRDWTTSRFAWLLPLPPRARGAVGEKLVECFLKQHGFEVARPRDREHDRVLNGRKLEIKFSTLWENGNYAFQQFRDQGYEFAIMLGISPHEAHGWFASKAELSLHVIGVLPQHGGAKGKDTAWLQFPPTGAPAWLRPSGGSLASLVDQLRREL